jgi:uncharacterized protein YodC (DUF2158 family)
MQATKATKPTTDGNDFQVGNIVQLKSGGPKMTVSALGNPGDVIHTGGLAAKGRVMCQWFAGSKLEQGFFPRESIVLASEVKKAD